MIKYTFLLLMLLLSPFVTMQADNLTRTLSIIPNPANTVPGDGNYRFSSQTKLAVENEEQAEVARNFVDHFTRTAGFTPRVTIGSKKGDVCFKTELSLKSEAYQLEITPGGITIKASDVKGFFYALQTIRLMLPAAIEGTQAASDEWSVPAVTIRDEPRFGYRGLMLDVARFFIPKANVLRIIDCMGMLKINKLHFHLVDDNGWRLEIKSHPRFTEIGAWRVDRTNVPFSDRRDPKPGEPTPVGGFYTQEDIKEIVAYAAQRQVEVIPEIEMPAHSSAALAAYPQLACPIVKNFIGVVPGMGGSNVDVIFCAGNDSVFSVLEDVIDEVTTLFPSRYIHLGGDEAGKSKWKKCPLCQARIKKEHLANEEDLQSYFMKRMGAYVRSKNKEVMGWDELTNSSIPEGAIIFGWQGMGVAAMKAAEQGHRFVMTPARIMYLIRYQGPQWFEPVTYFGNNTLKDVYDYEPIQEDWKPEYIPLLMGVQASLWTEFCNSPEDVDYLLFPRLAALAEVAWTKPEHKDWTKFLRGMDVYNEHIAVKGVAYARSMYNIQHTVTSERGALKVELNCIRPDVEIRYTTDGSEPTATSLRYGVPFIINASGVLKCATFDHGSQMGKTLELPIHWNKATAKPILGGSVNELVLTNGIRGSLKQTDSEWCCWEKSDSVSFTIDLQKKENFNFLRLGGLTKYGMAIHRPSLIQVYISDDNRTFRKVVEKRFTSEEIFREGVDKHDYILNPGKVQARYVRISAKGAGLCPTDHVRPGQEARVFFDEVIIE